MNYVRRLLLATSFVALAAGIQPSQAANLTVWMSSGDPGIAMFDDIAEQYKQSHPDTTFEVVSMPADQLIARSIAALNTNTAPDLIFDDYDRLIEIERSTQKLTDLKDVVAASPDASIPRAGDVRAATFNGKLILVPMQRVLVGLGVRKSWLEKVGETPPKTWDDVLRIGKKFKEAYPDAYPIGIHAGDAGSLIGAGVSLLTYGNGAMDVLVDDQGNVIIDKPEIAKPLVEYLKLFTEYKLVPPEATNYGFVDLYQLVEGGKAGMFRAGNWNVAKWDKLDPLAGDFLIVPYPSFGEGTGNFYEASLRGVGVPDNAPDKAEALEFAPFVLSKGAQQTSLDKMGGSVRSDLSAANVTPSLAYFLGDNVKIQSDDFLASVFPWYAELQEKYFQLLVQAIATPPADWDAWVSQTAETLRTELTKLKG